MEGCARCSRADAHLSAVKRVIAEGTDYMREEMPCHDHSTPFLAMFLQHDRQIGFFSRPCRRYNHDICVVACAVPRVAARSIPIVVHGASRLLADFQSSLVRYSVHVIHSRETVGWCDIYKPVEGWGEGGQSANSLINSSKMIVEYYRAGYGNTCIEQEGPLMVFKTESRCERTRPDRPYRRECTHTVGRREMSRAC